MIYTTNSLQPKTTDTYSEEQGFLDCIEQSAKGVLFHTYQRDAYSLLCLNGFKKFHDKRIVEETKELDKMKDSYMKKYNKLPVFDMSVDFWKKNSSLGEKMERTDICDSVKCLIAELIEWENKTLEQFLDAKGKMKDRKQLYEKIKGQLKSIDFLECVDEVLEKYGYSYEAVMEMDSYISG